MTGNADGGASGGATAYIGLGIAAAALGAATAVGVLLFNKAFGLVHQVVFDGVGAAIAPLGAWTLIPLVAAGGIVVALIVRFLRPEPLGAVPHIIDGVLERDGRLNDPTPPSRSPVAAVGIGFGMPLGADTPSAMIGGHLGSPVATWLGWSSTFVRALVVAGVAAGHLLDVPRPAGRGRVRVRGGPRRVRRDRLRRARRCIAVGVAGLRDLRARRDAGDLPGPADGGPLGRDACCSISRRGPGGPRRDRLRAPSCSDAKPLWSRVPLPPMGRMVLAGALVGLVGDLAAAGHGHRDRDDEGPVRRGDDPARDAARPRRSRRRC